MKPDLVKLAVVCCWYGCGLAMGAISPEQASKLPPLANHPVNFTREIKPILEASCVKCHGHGRRKGSFQIDTRETFLKGGESGAAVVVGRSLESSLIALVAGVDPENVMPQKGSRLTPEQIGLLRAWIDQGVLWDANVSFAKADRKSTRLNSSHRL